MKQEAVYKIPVKYSETLSIGYESRIAGQSDASSVLEKEIHCTVIARCDHKR